MNFFEIKNNWSSGLSVIILLWNDVRFQGDCGQSLSGIHISLYRVDYRKFFWLKHEFDFKMFLREFALSCVIQQNLECNEISTFKKLWWCEKNVDPRLGCHIQEVRILFGYSLVYVGFWRVEWIDIRTHIACRIFRSHVYRNSENVAKCINPIDRISIWSAAFQLIKVSKFISFRLQIP